MKDLKNLENIINSITELNKDHGENQRHNYKDELLQKLTWLGGEFAEILVEVLPKAKAGKVNQHAQDVILIGLVTEYISAEAKKGVLIYHNNSEGNSSEAPK